MSTGTGGGGRKKGVNWAVDGETEMWNLMLIPSFYVVRKQVLFLEQKRGGGR